ncbi:MAG: hypothetical protein AB7O26_18940 [Planctomycetaceae bacterium]
MPPKKKTTAAAPVARTARIRRVSRGDIERSAGHVGELSAQLQALFRQMEENSIRDIEIDGIGLLERGLDQIARFVDNVGSGVSRAQREKRRAL